MWKISFEPDRHLLTLRLRGHVGPIQMREIAAAQAQALEATGGTSFRVLIDLRGLHPMEAEAVALFADMKRVAAAVPGYEGCAVLADSPTVAMQQHRARLEADTGELITMDEGEVRRFLTPG
ncbi:MAG: hypothetical protein ACODAU_09490 [Myxococcota bacterium]